MLTYTPPLAEIRFVLRAIGFAERVPDLDPDLVEAILEEAGRFAAEVIAPLNPVGDREGCTRHPDGSVTTPTGYRDAYRQYREAGWGTLALPEEHGGQGLPHALATAVEEILVDCDQDALVLKVRPAGPACHTGERSCFYRALEGDSLTFAD